MAALIEEHERHQYWDAYLAAADDDSAESADEAPIESASLHDIHERL